MVNLFLVGGGILPIIIGGRFGFYHSSTAVLAVFLGRGIVNRVALSIFIKYGVLDDE